MGAMNNRLSKKQANSHRMAVTRLLQNDQRKIKRINSSFVANVSNGFASQLIFWYLKAFILSVIIIFNEAIHTKEPRSGFEYTCG